LAVALDAWLFRRRRPAEPADAGVDADVDADVLASPGSGKE
jgi:hypothetical protein